MDLSVRRTRLLTPLVSNETSLLAVVLGEQWLVNLVFHYYCLLNVCFYQNVGFSIFFSIWFNLVSRSLYYYVILMGEKEKRTFLNIFIYEWKGPQGKRELGRPYAK